MLLTDWTNMKMPMSKNKYSLIAGQIYSFAETLLKKN